MDTLETHDNRWFIDSWQHLMGALDEMLADARGNAASLEGATGKVDELLRQAEAERSATEATLRDFEGRRHQLAVTLDALQRELAISGLPLRGDIS